METTRSQEEGVPDRNFETVFKALEGAFRKQLLEVPDVMV
jgi:hypothetical protein